MRNPDMEPRYDTSTEEFSADVRLATNLVRSHLQGPSIDSPEARAFGDYTSLIETDLRIEEEEGIIIGSHPIIDTLIAGI